MLREPAAGPHRADTVNLHLRAVERVIDAMRRHIDEDFSLDEMAKLAFMSPFHFNRTFRERTGIPPGQFFSSLRIEAAKRLLLTTDLTVTDVCFEVGYNSLGTFIRRFGELVGASPRQLRALASLETGPPAAAGPAVSPSRADRILRGRVDAPDGFEGPVFVGLFPGPIPQGDPVACAALSGPGPFEMPLPEEDGRYRLFAAGLRRGEDSRGRCLLETALRGGGDFVDVPGTGVGAADITLRTPLSTDPPILLSLSRPAQEAPEPGLEEDPPLSRRS